MPLVAQRPRFQAATNGAVHLPAPTGGLNAYDPASAMPATDCLSLNNLIPYQYGLRVRSGWREWATNVSTAPVGLGLYDDGSPMAFSLAAPLGGPVIGGWPGVNVGGVRTLMAFYGSQPERDRLFACTPDGIYDVTQSTDAPVRVYQFEIGTWVDNLGNTIFPAGAGEGIYTSFTAITGDHYLAYCDGANGYLLYSEGTDSWVKVGYNAPAGPSIDPLLGDGVTAAPNPSSFRFVVQWKKSLWFCTENSSTAYYLPVNQFGGTLNQIPMGSQFRYGGALVGLWNWTVDGGTGVDDLLVGVSRGGDAVVYRGTDPTFVETFGIVGIYWLGEIPPGRRIATDFGGDLFVLGRLGCVPMSRLISGGLIRDPKLYETAKIGNLFNKLMTERGHLNGWGLKLHPSDNLLIISVPATPSAPQQQLAMSLANKGWSQLYNIPMSCMESWKHTLYFGTFDGRVCVNDGYSDGAALDGSGAYPVDFSILTAYQNLGSARKKRVHMVRPYFSTDGTPPAFRTEARYDFDLEEIGILPTALTPDANAWGTGHWDVAKWGSGSGNVSGLKGTRGIGTSVAFIVRGTSKSRVTLVGFDAIFDQGGLL